MALEMYFWEADGPKGEAVHHTVRLGKLEEHEGILKEFRACMSHGTIVRVTIERSDKQSPVSRTIWMREGYKDPFGE